MNRKGVFFVVFLCVFVFAAILVAYVEFARYFEELESSDNIAAGVIGEKQAAILEAVREGERVSAYTRIALQVAREQTLATHSCGSEYLGRRILTDQSCSDQLVQSFTQYFTALLVQYPQGSLAQSLDVPVLDADTITVTGTHRIPIAGADAQSSQSQPVGSGTFVGGVTGWPTGSAPRITSLFGNRVVQSGSKNHPGTDFSVNGTTGTPILAIADGNAVFFSRGLDSFVQVRSGNVVIDYMHVTAGPGISTTPTQVTAGQVIGYSAAYDVKGSAPHLHMQVHVPLITPEKARAAIPQHVGPSTTQTAQQSFGVISGDGTRVYLDPLCFFDRELIQQATITSSSRGGDMFAACDAYEQYFGLSRLVGNFFGASTVSQVPTTPIATQFNGTPAQASPKVTQTRQALESNGLTDSIARAAQTHKVPQELLLALITQESLGDPLAVSQTGCVGIGQFCSATARGMPEFFQQVTQCDCSGRSCLSPSSRKCTPENDDRFDAEKNIQAAAKLLGGHLQTYSKYQQQVTFALIAYNAGPSVSNQIRERTGGDPTWTQIETALKSDATITFGGVSNQAAKRAEVLGYINAIVTQHLPAWGGASFAATSFSPVELGYYSLRVEASIPLTARAAQAAAALQQAVATCADSACVQSAIASSASQYGVTITKEDLASSQGCMGEAERASAYLANQFRSCIDSPDTACSCALSFDRDARYELTATELRAIVASGTAVPDSAQVVLPSLSSGGSDGSAITSVQLRSGNTRTEQQIEVIMEPAGLRHDVSFAFDQTYTSAVKIPGGLALSTEDVTSKNSCVLPPSSIPQAYCIQVPSSSDPPLVVYLDQRLQTVPTVDAVQYSAKKQFFNDRVEVRLFADKEFSYARVRYTAPQQNYREQYINIVPSTQGILQLLGPGLPGSASTGVPREGKRTQLPIAPLPPHETKNWFYELTVEPQSGETMEFVFLDENLRETSVVVLQDSLSEDASGVQLPTDLLGPGLPTVGLPSTATSASSSSPAQTNNPATALTTSELLGQINPSTNPAFTELSSIYASRTGTYLQTATAEAFASMADAARSQGVELKVVSGTRTFADQKVIWERKWQSSSIIDPVDRARDILQFSSMPGTSRHHWGTDLDINSVEPSYFESGQGAAEYAWLSANAGRFGFVQTYDDTPSRSGYEEEKWHWSYLPSAQAYLSAYQSSVTYADITGFLGSDSAQEVDVIGSYVLSINTQ